VTDFVPGDYRTREARDLRDLCQQLSNAAAAHDSRMLEKRFRQLTQFFRDNGFGQGQGQDLHSPENWGTVQVRGARDAVRQFADRLQDGQQVILKSANVEDAIQKGCDLDEAASDIILKAAGDLAASGRVTMADAIEQIAKSAPQIWEAHSRSCAHTSEAYWRWYHGQRSRG